jgi:hypothetical protein
MREHGGDVAGNAAAAGVLTLACLCDLVHILLSFLFDFDSVGILL